MDEFEAYARQVNRQLGYLALFASQANLLDLLWSTTPEFRGMQDAGWNTAQTANEVYDELTSLQATKDVGRPEIRQMLALYSQLSEAGGFYETLSNAIGILEATPWSGWPFRELVKVKQGPKRIIGPNANAVFRKLATQAENVGMLALANVLETAFRDDLRNAISHADYIIDQQGVRLRKRNGGSPEVLSWSGVDLAVNKGRALFDLVRQHWSGLVRQFDPPQEVVGRFSNNPPFKYTVGFEPRSKSFSISTSSPGPVTTPQFERQEAINAALTGSVFVVFGHPEDAELLRIDAEMRALGFAPKTISAQAGVIAEIVAGAEQLWHEDQPNRPGGILLASPFGYFQIAPGQPFPDWALPQLEELEFNP
jgi:hypothetical protein